MSKYPRLSHKEVRDEIVKRTHQDRQVVMAIMSAHRDIIREALCNGIEVSIADLCTLTFYFFNAPIIVCKPPQGGLFMPQKQKLRKGERSESWKSCMKDS